EIEQDVRGLGDDELAGFEVRRREWRPRAALIVDEFHHRRRAAFALAARHIDIIGAGFFQRQTDEFAAPLDLRPVVKLVTHSRHPCSISQASTAPTAIQHRETEKTLIQPYKR